MSKSQQSEINISEEKRDYLTLIQEPIAVFLADHCRDATPEYKLLISV